MSGPSASPAVLASLAADRPTDAARALEIAQQLESAGEGAAAARCLAGAIAASPGNADVMGSYGRIAPALGDAGAALRWLGRALAVEPGRYDALMAVGTLRLMLREPAMAARLFERAVEANPGSPDPLVMLGNALASAGAPDSVAIVPFRAVADRFPERPWLYAPLVQYFHNAGDQPNCERYAKQMIDRYEEIAEADPIGRFGIRVLPSEAVIARMGETGLQLGLHVKAGIMGWRRPIASILAVPAGRAANAAYVDYWREHVTIVTDPALVARTAELEKRILHDTVYVRVPDGRVLSKNRAVHYCEAQWEREKRPPLLTLKAEHLERGWQALAQLGMPKGAWFACLHVREGGYMRETPGSQEAFRNCDIFTYLPAVAEITRRGGWVVRIGDRSMKPLPPLPQVIDYVHSPAKSEWMDIFLSGACRFVLGSGSGMSTIAQLFGRPIADTNWFPAGNHIWTGREIYIVKRYWSDTERRFLDWHEVMTPPLALTYDARMLTRTGIRVVDNTEEEIRELCLEMLDRLDGAPYTAEDDALQDRWHALKRRYWQEPWLGRIGREFLKRHADSLGR
jgi:putative glycosyltransferase (TIGR04372 family)